MSVSLLIFVCLVVNLNGFVLPGIFTWQFRWKCFGGQLALETMNVDSAGTDDVIYGAVHYYLSGAAHSGRWTEWKRLDNIGPCDDLNRGGRELFGGFDSIFTHNAILVFSTNPLSLYGGG